MTADPVETLEYKGYTISVFAWGKSGRFYAEFDNGVAADWGAAQGLYPTPEDAIAACQDLIDHPMDTRITKCP